MHIFAHFYTIFLSIKNHLSVFLQCAKITKLNYFKNFYFFKKKKKKKIFLHFQPEIFYFLNISNKKKENIRNANVIPEMSILHNNKGMLNKFLLKNIHQNPAIFYSGVKIFWKMLFRIQNLLCDFCLQYPVRSKKCLGTDSSAWNCALPSHHLFRYYFFARASKSRASEQRIQK